VNLSPHFSLAELTFSETAIRAGREISPDETIIANLRNLCVSVLEPLREALGAPIVISSGYRPEWLNIIVGGSKTSDHMSGRAADIRAIGLAPIQVCRKACELELPTNQVILEFGRWCHISVAPINAVPRGDVLTAKSIKGQTTYYPGLVA
jgi:zinc D-Ala-D-Ala carboxypeptidase